MSELILCLNVDSLSHNYVVLIILTFNFIYDLVTHNADFFIIIVFFIFFYVTFSTSCLIIMTL